MHRRGRVVEMGPEFISLQNERGAIRISVDTAGVHLGDLVELKEGQLRVLTPNRAATRSMKGIKRILDPRRVRAMKLRSQVETGIREFFLGRSFHEVRTPLLVVSPGMEPHIRPFPVKSSEDPSLLRFLPTSPEFAMKKLLVGGLERIFQMCSSFRDEPHSPFHRPEFMMLEWYQAYSGYETLMEEVEALFEFLALRLFGKPILEYQGKAISVKAPWPRLSIRSLFLEQVGVSLQHASTVPLLRRECDRLGLLTNEEDTWDDLFFKIWLNRIEPNLPPNQAVFVTQYPESQAALAVLEEAEDGSRWAKRFEVYAGGMELGNAFEELTDPFEQRRRFVEDMELRKQIYGSAFPPNPMDEEFLEALEEGMPPSSGIAMGVDRIAMLFSNENDIEYLNWL